MTPKRILIVEDDRELADLLRLHLEDMNYSVARCANGRVGLKKALEGNHDLLILDLMLPEIDGLEICRTLRSEGSYLPILMLTSRSEETDRVLGLELGADDYLTKPFSIRELLARVKAIFRRVEQLQHKADDIPPVAALKFVDLEIDVSKRKTVVAGRPVELTTKEFDLLKLFSSNPGRAYSRADLLSIVWGYQFDGYDHTVNSHINRLRAKIEADPAHPKYIKTVWGYGYRFAELKELEA